MQSRSKCFTNIFFQPLQVKPLFPSLWRWGMEKPLHKGARLACAELHRVMMPKTSARTAQKPRGWDSSLDQSVNSLRWSAVHSSLWARSSAPGSDSHTRSKRQRGASKGWKNALGSRMSGPRLSSVRRRETSYGIPSVWTLQGMIQMRSFASRRRLADRAQPCTRAQAAAGGREKGMRAARVRPAVLLRGAAPRARQRDGALGESGCVCSAGTWNDHSVLNQPLQRKIKT